MKLKIFTLIIISAIITLSFTFASVKESKSRESYPIVAPSNNNEPVGGFAFDEK